MARRSFIYMQVYWKGQREGERVDEEREKGIVREGERERHVQSGGVGGREEERERGEKGERDKGEREPKCLDYIMKDL